MRTPWSPARWATAAAVAVLLLQVAWSMVVAPFRGIDEFDHVYRAEAVAHGQVLSTQRAKDGRGELVDAKAATVLRAGPVCSWYEYTGPDNCRAVRDLGDGRVEVASAAARYQPLFYVVTGLASAPVAGFTAVYVQRAAAGLLCLAVLWLGWYALAAGFSTSWPAVAALTALTPGFVYSTMLGAPNGVEMCAGFSLAATLCVLARSGPRALERRLIGFATIAAVVLAVARTLGPEFLAVNLTVLLLYVGRSRLSTLWSDHRRLLQGCLATVATALAYALAWNAYAAPNSGSDARPVHAGSAFPGALDQIPLWPLQAFGAFPTRSEAAPPLAYGAGLVALLLLIGVVAMSVRGHRGWWLSFVGLNAGWLAVQFAITAATYDRLGPIWQGRYALPLAATIPIVLFAWADRLGVKEPRLWVPVAVTGLLGLAEVVSIGHVWTRESTFGPLRDSTLWSAPPFLLCVAVAGLGAALLTLVTARHPGTCRPTAHQGESDERTPQDSLR